MSFSIMGLDACYTITPFAHLDRVQYTLNVDGQAIMTFDSKETAVQMAQLMYC